MALNCFKCANPLRKCKCGQTFCGNCQKKQGNTSNESHCPSCGSWNTRVADYQKEFFY